VERVYRRCLHSTDLIQFEVRVGESDLLIAAGQDLRAVARRSVIRHRRELKEYIAQHSEFRTSTGPLPCDEQARPVIRMMQAASQKTGVGPMAAVAGAIAQVVGEDLLKVSSEIVVENGGDVFISSCRPRVASIFAGDSPLSQRVGIRLKGSQLPLGICTSAGSVGPSYSGGNADAVVVVARDTALADAAATAAGNLVESKRDIKRALEFAMGLDSCVIGIVVIIGDHIGARGDIELTAVSS